MKREASVLALVLAVAILAAGVLVSRAIDRASHRTIIVNVQTTCKTGGSAYGRRC